MHTKPPKIHLKKTELTPLVCLDYENTVMKISGISVPENAAEFYKPVLDWLEVYSKTPKEKAVFSIFLDYFNTASSKVFLEVMKRFKKIANHKIEWVCYSDDEDMLEAIQDYKEMMGNIIVERIITR